KFKQNSFELPIVKLFGKNIHHLPLSNEIKNQINDLIGRALMSNQVEFFECKINILEEIRTYELRFTKCGYNRVVVIVRDISKRKTEEGKIKKLLDKERTLNQDLEFQNEMMARKEEELAQVNNRLVLQNENLFQTTRELRKSREKLKETLKVLEERNFELDQFVYKTSHDLRSPLSSVLGIINLMKIDREPGRQDEYVARIESSIQRLDVFIQSMLNFSRNHRAELKPERINYQQILEHCVEDLKYISHYKEIQIEWQIQGAHVDFQSDTQRIKIIFNNIISNAIKYQDFGKEDRYIRVNIQIVPEKTTIIFEDNGIGIEKEYLKDIYKMFFRATEESEGSGLGMYIVKQTVNKLKGKISIDSAGSGQGLTVKVDLPNHKKQKELAPPSPIEG
ncbi:MAG: HAMP domain-containing sensor histidine kinase, partial [Bacteroidota bacterium]